MDGVVLMAINGLALGLASTLHCAGMCGAISCGLLLQERGGARNPYAAFALTHLGRVSAYAIAGALIGALGATAIGWLDRGLAFRLLQWAAATSLIWIGLSIAGLVPSFAGLDRGLSYFAGAVARANAAAQRRAFVPLLSGLAWGLMPCAMVYAALFTAMLTGSAAGGAVTMASFGIGTLPGLVAASFGFRRLASVNRSAPQRIAAGLAIAVFGGATVLVAHPVAAYLCLPWSHTAATAPAAPLHAATAIDRSQAAAAVSNLGSATRPATE